MRRGWKRSEVSFLIGVGHQVHHGAVIVAAVACLDGMTPIVIGGAGDGQVKVQTVGLAHDQADILSHRVKGGTGIIGAGQDEFREANLGGVASGIADIEYVDHRLGVDAQRYAEIVCLAGGQEGGVGQLVVDQLHIVAAARRAQIEQRLADFL